MGACSLNPLDFYGLDGLLSEEEKLIRSTVRQFIDGEVFPVIEKHFEEGTTPVHLIPRLAELGVFGSNLQGYGCPGLNNVAYGLIMQELERGDSGLRSFSSVQSALVMYPIYAFGSEEQKQKYLPKLARAELIGCFGLTEPDFGSNPSGIRTKAVRTSSGTWVLDGTKMWITNGSLAHVAVVWARDEEKRFQGFLVDKGTPGFSTREIRGKFSLRASDTSELILERCEVPDTHRLPRTQGFKSALMCLNQARYGIAWGVLGAMEHCFESALNYSKTRIQFGKPIASFQLVQQKLVTMLTEYTKAKALCLHLGRLKDQNQAVPEQISLAKRNNVAMALETARLARDILAANGIVNEYPVFRHMVNLETVNTYEGTHDIHTLILGEAITGCSAFS